MTPEEQSIHDDVQRFGWSAMNVFEDKEGPGFQYSIGFFRSFKHPEVLIFGQQRNVMHGMLTRIADGIREGKQYAAGTEAEDILDGYDACFGSYQANLFPNTWVLPIGSMTTKNSQSCSVFGQTEEEGSLGIPKRAKNCAVENRFLIPSTPRSRA